MGKFIVITGLDGSGTTTIAHELQKQDHESVLLITPDQEYEKCRKNIDCIVKNASELAHYFFYLSSNIYVSEKIKSLRKENPNSNIYCVRYMMDTVVSHRANGLEIDLKYNIHGISLVKPDFTFFLSLPEDIRQHRISKRTKGKGRLDRLLDDSNVRKRFLHEYKRYHEEISYIDASKSVNAIVDEIKEKVFHG